MATNSNWVVCFTCQHAVIPLVVAACFGVNVMCAVNNGGGWEEICVFWFRYTSRTDKENLSYRIVYGILLTFFYFLCCLYFLTIIIIIRFFSLLFIFSANLLTMFEDL